MSPFNPTKPRAHFCNAHVLTQCLSIARPKNGTHYSSPQRPLLVHLEVSSLPRSERVSCTSFLAPAAERSSVGAAKAILII